MAGESPVKGLCEETTCPLCLDYFTDPVITDCGHNFCQACLTQCWGASQEDVSCPQCREISQQRTFRPNRQLANVAELVKKLQEGKKREIGAREGKRGACKIHQEPLKFFCRVDETPICVVCDSRAKEHRGHTVLPLEEAFQEYKKKTKIHLDILKKKREELKHQKLSEELKKQKYQRELEREKMGIKSLFERMQKFLEEKQHFCLVQLEDLEKEMETRHEKSLTNLSEECFQVSLLITEMEEKCLQPASEFLQDIRNSLARCEMNSVGYVVDDSPELEERLRFLSDNFFNLEEAAGICKEKLEGVLIIDISEQTLNTGTLTASRTCLQTREGTVASCNPTSSTMKKEPKTKTQVPLQQDPVPGTGGSVTDHYVPGPFSTTDLLNWKAATPKIQEDVDSVYRTFDTIFSTHSPRWQDIQILLKTLLTKDEKTQVLRHAAALPKEDPPAVPAGVDPIEAFDPATLSSQVDPNWNYNSLQGQHNIRKMEAAILEGIRKTGQRTTNWSKITEISQREDEHPSEYYQRLIDAIRKWGNIDPDDADQVALVRSLYRDRAYNDIKKALNAKDDFEGLSMPQVVAIATNVFNKRDKKRRREKEKEDKERMKSLAAAIREEGLQGRGSKRGRGRNIARERNNNPPTCFWCYREGHMQWDCPLRSCNQNPNPMGMCGRQQEGPGNNQPLPKLQKYKTYQNYSRKREFFHDEA